jgi:hypothetical protein
MLIELRFRSLKQSSRGGCGKPVLTLLAVVAYVIVLKLADLADKSQLRPVVRSSARPLRNWSTRKWVVGA